MRAQIRLVFIAMLGLWLLSGCGSSMTSCWKLNEGKGAIAHDSISNKHGDIYGATWTTGISGTSLNFDGRDDYVQSTRNIDQDSSTGITMAAWVYPTSTSPGRHQVISTDNGGFDWSILRQGRQWRVFTGDSSWDSGFTVDLNTWQHVAAVFKPDEDVIFYKNAARHLRGSAPTTDANDNNIAIGNNPGPWDEYFQGKIDEVAIYKKALSAKNIEKLYRKSASRCKAVITSNRQTNETAKVVPEKPRPKVRKKPANLRELAEIEKTRAETRKLRQETEKVEVETQKLREEIRLLRAKTKKIEAEAEQARQQAGKTRAETELLKDKSETNTK